MWLENILTTSKLPVIIIEQNMPHILLHIFIENVKPHMHWSHAMLIDRKILHLGLVHTLDVFCYYEAST